MNHHQKRNQYSRVTALQPFLGCQSETIHFPAIPESGQCTNPNLSTYVDKKTINFGSLDLSTGIITTTVNYNMSTLDLAMKDYYVCNDSSSVVVVENHRETDIISLTQHGNFMNGAKTWLTRANTTLFVSSQEGLVVSIYN